MHIPTLKRPQLIFSRKFKISNHVRGTVGRPPIPHHIEHHPRPRYKRCIRESRPVHVMKWLALVVGSSIVSPAAAARPPRTSSTSGTTTGASQSRLQLPDVSCPAGATQVGARCRHEGHDLRREFALLCLYITPEGDRLWPGIHLRHHQAHVQARCPKGTACRPVGDVRAKKFYGWWKTAVDPAARPRIACVERSLIPPPAGPSEETRQVQRLHELTAELIEALAGPAVEFSASASVQVEPGRTARAVSPPLPVPAAAPVHDHDSQRALSPSPPGRGGVIERTIDADNVLHTPTLAEVEYQWLSLDRDREHEQDSRLAGVVVDPTHAGESTSVDVRAMPDQRVGRNGR